MIIIYTQDNTFIRNNAASAKADLIKLYGEKLGKEAFDAIKDKRPGTSYRKNGGPLVKVVDADEAERIKAKELSAGIEISA